VLLKLNAVIVPVFDVTPFVVYDDSTGPLVILVTRGPAPASITDDRSPIRVYAVADVPDVPPLSFPVHTATIRPPAAAIPADAPGPQFGACVAIDE
jgi:hypothetical protein